MTANIGESGIFVKCSDPLKVGATVVVVCLIPGLDQRRNLPGRVVRAVSDGADYMSAELPGLGIEFINPPKELKEAVRKFTSFKKQG